MVDGHTSGIMQLALFLAEEGQPQGQGRVPTQPLNGEATTVLVDGLWSAWGAWGHCSKTCGGGTRERHRTCTNPAPSHGGANCIGSLTVTESCNTQHCPIAGSWSAWGAWGKCSVTCGRGAHERHRTCSNPAPSHGGADCVGSTTLTQHCESVHCPIDGSWSAWGAWGHCSVTCGGGTKERHRTCSNPVPSHGGANCVGSNKNSHNCNDASCPTAAPGVPCPVCDPSMNCVWGNECPDGQTCMIRSYPHYKFTVHCSILFGFTVVTAYFGHLSDAITFLRRVLSINNSTFLLF
uniref:Hemicentin-1 n=1 Tax=Magallana gigas TaxID=29159 RepID=K1Q6Z0_MAGGI